MVDSIAIIYTVLELLIGSSPVPGFESQAEQFISDMKQKGLTIATCATAFS